MSWVTVKVTGAAKAVGMTLPLIAVLLVPPAYAQLSATMAASANQAIAAGAPASEMQDLVSRWERRGYPARPGLAVIEAITQAARDDLPTEPLLQKAMEGLAKGVSPERIAVVVEHRARTLREARALLDIASPDVPGHQPGRDRAIHALADALFQGASRDDLARTVRRVRSDKGAESARWVEAAADAVAGLMSSGIPSKEAADLATLKLRQSSVPAEMRQLSGQALALRRNGLSPPQVVEQLRRTVEGGRPSGSPSMEPPPAGPPTTPRPPLGPLPRPSIRPPAR